MRAAAWLLCALAATGCRKEPRGAAPPLDNTSSDAPASTRPSPDAGADCVTTCVAAGQMRATSPEQIEADCRRDCGK